MVDLTEMKGIPGFLGYFATKDGRVFSAHGFGGFAEEPFQLKGEIVKTGYQRVTLFVRERRCRLYVHRLILLAFRGPCPLGHECDHIDGNRTNNSLDNLSWVTKLENIRRAARRNHWSNPQARGEKHPCNKLTRYQVLAIREVIQRKELAAGVLAKIFNVSLSTIFDIVHRRTWAWLEDLL